MKLLGQPPGAAGAVRDNVGQRCQVNPGLDAQGQGFGEQDADAHAHEVVADLADRTGADVAAVDHVAADGSQHRLEAVEGGAVAADHDGQRARRRAVGAAADRRVQQRHAPLGTSFLQPPDYGGRVGGEVEDDRAATCALQDSALSQDHCLYVPRDGEAG